MAGFERVPRPTRTKEGKGVGAKVALEVVYYRPPTGEGADYGTFSGRDGDGPWELHFEGEGEFHAQLKGITNVLTDVATEARDDDEDQREAGRSVWLKSIGVSDSQVAEEWWAEADNETGLDFPFRPRSIKAGDLLVVYASGTGNVVGVVETISEWYPGGKRSRWPYRMNSKILAQMPVSKGVPLATLSDEREITKSIRQKSHIRLSSSEASTALTAFGVDV
jgi:hypothetical protein